MRYAALLIMITALLGGCAKPAYQYNREGMVVNSQRAYYVNEPLWLVLSMPGDFHYQPADTGKGVQVGYSRPEDKAVLRQLGIAPEKATILYNATPVKPPYYHLVALLHHDSSGLSKGMARKYTHAAPSYWYRKVEYKKREIYQALLPYRDGAISLVYYAARQNDCHYCDIENIATFNYNWLVKNAGGGSDSTLREVALEVPSDSLSAKEMGVMLVHRLDNSGKVNYQTFVPMAAGEHRFNMSLQKGLYRFSYMDRQQHIRWSRQMHVD
ncbi:hypothetical protein [Chitinophaga parva]|nr:hypothetical protein [Chitinophaga parva]